MKNFKIYKSALALITSASILLLSGCNKDSNKSNTIDKNDNISKVTEQVEENQSCWHLCVSFENETITFKQCEGYDISASLKSTGFMSYLVYKDDKLLINGYTRNYNSYHVNHDVADEIIENESIQKVKK